MADDPRLAVIREHLLATLHENRRGDDYYRGILAALDAHAAKAPEGTVPLRIAVAFDDENRPHVERVIDGDFHGDEAAWVTLATWRDALRRSSIITADVPLPVVPEIEGRVEK